jgi:hypothetical protein
MEQESGKAEKGEVGLDTSTVALPTQPQAAPSLLSSQATSHMRVTGGSSSPRRGSAEALRTEKTRGRWCISPNLRRRGAFPTCVLF